MSTPQSSLEHDWFWTADGKAIGYRENDNFFSCCGAQIGAFEGDDLYSVAGPYLGEVSKCGRLVANPKKLAWRRPRLAPASANSLEPPPDVAPQQLTPGYRNFKSSGTKA